MVSTAPCSWWACGFPQFLPLPYVSPLSLTVGVVPRLPIDKNTIRVYMFVCKIQ